MRDDFPETVKRVLARRVSYRCSKPDCRASTSGPHSEPGRAVSVGVAAHITAASSEGPRYDPNLTPEERCAPQNGIWLCALHGTLVDTDATTYPVSILLEWKTGAEAKALNELGAQLYIPGPAALEELLVRAGDLPGGLEAAQVRSIPPKVFHGLPSWDAFIYRELASARPHWGGGISLFRYDSPVDLEIAFIAISVTFGSDSAHPFLRSASRFIPRLGERARVASMHLFLPPLFDLNLAQLVVAQTPYLLNITASGTDHVGVVAYAQRVLPRLPRAPNTRGAS